MPTKTRNPSSAANPIGTIHLPAVSPSFPHEQAERIATPAEPQGVMIQAQRDIARGLEDTDCYTRLGKLIPRPRKK